MTDIDFDELDKAVNTVLGPRADKKAEEPTPAAAPEAEAKTEAPTAEAEKTPAAAAPTIQLRPRQPIASPAAKRAGRFMDVVHPSSDMASTTKAAPAPRVKIVPTADAPKPEPKPETKPEETTDKPALDKEVEATTEAEAETSVASVEQSFAPQYPDPLDVMEKTEEKAEDKPADISEEELSDVLEDEVEPEAPTPAATAPAETPFIPDAKVEKRPLGGISPDPKVPSDETLAPMTDELPAETEDIQLPPETDLPPALQSDVVAVESDVVDIDVEAAAPEAVAEVEKSDAPEPATKEEKSVEPATEVKPQESPVDTNTGPAQSIPQQYRSETATTDETPRPVFDTEQYHQPLIPAHAGPKHHTGLFILLILALLLVGAGLGYFAFVSGI